MMRKSLLSEPAQMAEPYTEPVTIKFTPSQKKDLLKASQESGYSNVSRYVRDMVSIGVRVHPFLDKTIKDIVRLT